MENAYREYLNELAAKEEELTQAIEELKAELKRAEDEEEACNIEERIEYLIEERSDIQEEYDEYEEAGKEEDY